MKKMLALSMDIDGPFEYAAIHGRAVGIPNVLNMYKAHGPVRRFMQMCTQLDVRATLFVVARDIHGEAQSLLAEAADSDRFEIACHSNAHDYHLSRRPKAVIADDIERARTRFMDTLGIAPTGFRAPGYHLSPALIGQIAAQGFHYDSSVFPSGGYYAVKAMVMAYYRLKGKNSSALLGSPRMTQAPRLPYRPGLQPYQRGQSSLIEIPISVVGPLGLPITGALLGLSRPWVTRQILRPLRAQPLTVLNVHAIDFMDAEYDEFPEALTALQPELRVPLGVRMARIAEAIMGFRRSHQSATLSSVATLWDQKLDRR